MRVTLTEQNLQQALTLIDQVPGRSRTAVARAMSESVRWGRGQMARAISQQTGLPQKHFRPRVRVTLAKARSERMFAQVVGLLNPMLAESLGLLVRVPGGAALDPTVRNQKGKQYFGGAFIVSKLGSHWFMRTAPGADSKSQLWTAGRRKTPGTENLPITRPTVDIAPDQATIDRISEQIVGQFNQRADRLLRWELEKAAKRGAL